MFLFFLLVYRAVYLFVAIDVTWSNSLWSFLVGSYGKFSLKDVCKQTGIIATIEEVAATILEENLFPYYAPWYVEQSVVLKGVETTLYTFKLDRTVFDAF